MASLFDEFEPPPTHGPYQRPGVPVRPLSRESDPATSAEAAAGHQKSGRLGRNARAVLDLVHAHPGSTAIELHSLLPFDAPDIDRHEVSRRLADLEHAGQVTKGPPRARNPEAKPETTWFPAKPQETEDGPTEKATTTPVRPTGRRRRVGGVWVLAD